MSDAPVVAEPDVWTSTSVDGVGGTVTQTETAEPVVETPPAEPTEAAPEPEAAAPADGSGLERDQNGKFKPKEKARNNPYVRVKDATAETAREREARLAAEQRASDLERRLQELERSPARTATPPEPAAAPGRRPKPSEDEVGTKYATYADYVEDLTDWKLEQRSGPDVESLVQAKFEERQQREALAQHVSSIVERGKQRFPDFEQVVNSLEVAFSPMHQLAILQSEDSEAIQYALAKDPELAQRIASIDNEFRLGLEFAKLTQSTAAVARPDSASLARPSSAKPPINRVGGTASAAPLDPDDLDFGPDYIRVENERERKRQQASRW